MDLDYIISRTEAVPREHRLNAAKEALQETLLAVLGLQGGLEDTAFQGGTALRILHRLPRYSEDLDFIWTSKRRAPPRPTEWAKIIAGHLRKIGIVPHLSDKTETVDAHMPKRVSTIHLAVMEPKLAALFRGSLQISFEIDLDPPAGWKLERKIAAIANSPVAIPALDLPSLMAGKLHILITRRDREKGRDWFDYLWYRRRGIEPNLVQLQNAVDQTSRGIPARLWMSIVRQRLPATNWPAIRQDAERLLERPADAEGLSERTLADLTPYPDFVALLAEVKKARSLPTGWGMAMQAVRDDIAVAALDGDAAAAELDQVCKGFSGPTNERGDATPDMGP